MSLYSRIDRAINADARFRALSHDAQLIYLRLLTGAHVTSVPGLWSATAEGLAANWRFGLEQFRERFAELSRDRSGNRLAYADWEAGVVWLPDAIDHSDPANLNVVRGWSMHIKLVPNCELKTQALGELVRWLRREKAVPKAEKDGWFCGFTLDAAGVVVPDAEPGRNGSAAAGPESANGSGNGMPNQKQEQEQEQELKPKKLKAKRPEHGAPALQVLGLDAVRAMNSGEDL